MLLTVAKKLEISMMKIEYILAENLIYVKNGIYEYHLIK